MSNTPAFQYYPADLIADPEVMLWDSDDIGCYWLLINYLWISGGKIEENLENFRKIFRKKTKKTAKLKWDKIKIKFICEDGFIAHKRVLKEMQKQAENRLKKIHAAEVRWGKADANAMQVDTTEPMQMQCPSTPTPITYIYNNNNKPNNTISNEQPKGEIVENSPEEKLALDLLIAKERKRFTKEISKIFTFTNGEAHTFAKITAHLVSLCQSQDRDVGIFQDAIEWAKQAKASSAKNKKGLFVAKIKKETGFMKAERLLK